MVRKAFSCDFFVVFLVAPGAQKSLKPCDLRGFCDLLSHAKGLGTSCCKKGLEGVFGRFLARLGKGKNVKKHVFYECFVTFCVGMELMRKSSQIRSGRTVKAIDRTRHMIRSSLSIYLCLSLSLSLSLSTYS